MAYNPYTGRWEMDGAQQVQMQPMPRAQVPQMPQQPPKLGVLTVASEASINNLQMQPNDNALALHETENLLYYIRTDSMAAKTIARFRIFPEPTEEEKAATQLQEQLKQITDGLQSRWCLASSPPSLGLMTGLRQTKTKRSASSSARSASDTARKRLSII